MPYRAAEAHPMTSATSGSQASGTPMREYRGLTDKAIRSEVFPSW